MIECRGGGIYTGIAKDVQARYEQHLKGKGAKYTKMNPPIQLLTSQPFSTHREAAQEEWRIKRLSPLEKRSHALLLSNSADNIQNFNSGVMIRNCNDVGQ